MRYLSSQSPATDKLNWARSLHQIVLASGDDEAAQQIQTAINQFHEANFSLAVLGKVKRGKSTLINALLGRNDDLAAPVDRLPASSTVSRFRWGQEEAVDVYFRDGRRQQVSLNEVRAYATEELNPKNAKNVELLEISGPFEGLANQLELVDTPGAGSLHEHHDELLHAFIPQADAVIFLVTAQMPLDQDELDLLKKVRAADVSKIFFAINRLDEATPDDLSDAEAHNRRLLDEIGLSTSKFYRISAKRAFQGQAAESGVPELLADIQSFVQTQKGAILADRLTSRVQLAVEPVVWRIELEHHCSHKTQEELIAEQERLAQENKRLQKERPLVEREFKNRWENTLLRFQHALDVEERTVRKRIVERVESASLVNITSLGKSLPTELQEIVDEQLQEPAQQLEASLLEATHYLQASYPQLHFGELEIYSIRPNTDSTLAAGTAMGVATWALGGGLIAAGGATAASIASANAAAAAAATSSVMAPTAVGSLLTTLFPQSAGLVGTFLTGNAVVSAPVAYTAAPLWVALSGPIGWTMVGIGTLAVPFAWRISKIRSKEKLVEAVKSQVKVIFRQIRQERVAHLQEMEQAILDDFKLRSDRQVHEIDNMLEELREKPRDAQRVEQLASWSRQLSALLNNSRSSSDMAGGHA